MKHANQTDKKGTYMIILESLYQKDLQLKTILIEI